MTQPLLQTITLTRGDDYSATITFDQAVAGFAEMRLTIREDWATDQTDNTTATLSVLLTGTGTNTAALALTAAQTVALQFDSYFYDLQVTSTGGKKYTTQRGTLRVTPDVTR